MRKTDAGVVIGPNSSTPQDSKGIMVLYTTPAIGYEILIERDAIYVHLLFGLKERYARVSLSLSLVVIA